jgi:hypothetical protein
MLRPAGLGFVSENSGGVPPAVSLDEPPRSGAFHPFVSAEKTGRVEFALGNLGLVIEHEETIGPAADAGDGSINPQFGCSGEKIVHGPLVGS